MNPTLSHRATRGEFVWIWKKRRNTLNNLNWTCLLAGHPYRLIYLAGGLPSHFHPYISRSKFMWTVRRTSGRTDIRRWLSLTIIKPFLSTLFINTLQKQLFVPGFLLSTFIPSLRLSSLLFLGCSFFPLHNINGVVFVILGTAMWVNGGYERGDASLCVALRFCFISVLGLALAFFSAQRVVHHR